MISDWLAVFTALGYLAFLFALALWGDLEGRRLFTGRLRGSLYALGLCVYCTSWTFFGSVGLASVSGFDFLPIYLSPIIVFVFGRKLLARVVRLAKTNNLTTVADFVSARYGKAEGVAALVALVALVGVTPYVALQIKAISASFMMVRHFIAAGALTPPAGADAWIVPMVAAALAAFTVAFGARRVEARQHLPGVMLAICSESIVKLAAFLAAGGFVVWGMFGGPLDLARQALAEPRVSEVFLRWPDPWVWSSVTLMSACAVVLLPRQFHVAVVENRHPADLRRAGALFPAYLILINLFVAPMAAAGLLLCPEPEFNRDMTVLALPLIGGSPAMALLAMVGGFAAAAAMVVMSCLALSVMISNDLVIPLLLRWSALRPRLGSTDIGRLILSIRRAAIVGLISLGYVFLTVANEASLASIGVLSFTAIAQIAPAFVGGLVWRRANARGAAAGLLVGAGLWLALLLAPALSGHADAGAAAMPIHAMAKAALLCLAGNVAAFIAFSLSRPCNQIEHVQAAIFIGDQAQPRRLPSRAWSSAIQINELEGLVARYLGAERARAAFRGFFAQRRKREPDEATVDADTLRFAEQTLAGALGAASSRLVLSLALRRRNLSRAAALDIVDEASAAIQRNEHMLQHAIDFAQQGISVFDAELKLVFWNREFHNMFDYPPHLAKVGASLADMVRHDVQRGLFGDGSGEEFTRQRLEMLIGSVDPVRLPMAQAGAGGFGVVELRGARMPEGGLVVTYTDVTQQVEAEQALAQINETLELRVRERTDELMAMNKELERAKAAADEANVSKTRFLAAASHDILQPLNAARLFATALAERTGALQGGGAMSEAVALARNVDASLHAVEDILTALLDMSRLDAGAMKPELTTFHIADILGQLQIEFAPLAAEKGLKLVFSPCAMAVRSDRRLLRRLLQNLVSNAIKYTNSGSVLVGCRRQRGRLRIEVWDTGPGIPESKRKAVFREFERLENGSGGAHGLGLGLSIVERLARVLGHRIELRSWPGRGSVFSVEAPAAPVTAATAQAAAPSGATMRHQPLAGLVVAAFDDEPRILEGMVALLQGWGCAVVAAETRGQAESRLAARGLIPQVLIADYHLGPEVGIDVIAHMRRTFGEGLPAILLTADRTQSVFQEAERSGIALLNKPIKPAALRALLAQWHVTRMAAE